MAIKKARLHEKLKLELLQTLPTVKLEALSRIEDESGHNMLDEFIDSRLKQGFDTSRYQDMEDNVTMDIISFLESHVTSAEQSTTLKHVCGPSCTCATRGLGARRELPEKLINNEYALIAASNYELAVAEERLKQEDQRQRALQYSDGK